MVAETLESLRFVVEDERIIGPSDDDDAEFSPPEREEDEDRGTDGLSSADYAAIAAEMRRCQEEHDGQPDDLQELQDFAQDDDVGAAPASEVL